MTFRRRNNENASGQESGTFEDCNRQGFPSQSHFRSLAFVSKSINVYSYETLAYSGSTLPRRFRNVSMPFSSKNTVDFSIENSSRVLHSKDMESRLINDSIDNYL